MRPSGPKQYRMLLFLCCGVVLLVLAALALSRAGHGNFLALVGLAPNSQTACFIDCGSSYPPRFISYGASPSIIIQGQSTTVSFTVQNTSSDDSTVNCVSNAGLGDTGITSGAQGAIGSWSSAPLYPTSDTTYTIQCVASRNGAVQTTVYVPVTVCPTGDVVLNGSCTIPNAPTDSITYNYNSGIVEYAPDGSGILSWCSSNAYECTITTPNNSQAEAPNNCSTYSGIENGPGPYSIACANSFGVTTNTVETVCPPGYEQSGSQCVELCVNGSGLYGQCTACNMGYYPSGGYCYADSFNNFYASPSAVFSGNASTLYWSTGGMTDCTLSGGIFNNTAEPCSGNASTGSLTSNTTYTLSYTEPDVGTYTAQAQVLIAVGSVSINANPTNINSGATSTLSWNSSFVQPGSCTLSASPASSGSGSTNLSSWSSSANMVYGQSAYFIANGYLYSLGGNESGFGGMGGGPWGPTVWRTPVGTEFASPSQWVDVGSMPSQVPTIYTKPIILNMNGTPTLYLFGGVTGLFQSRTDTICSVPVANVANSASWDCSSSLPTGAGIDGGPLVIGNYIYRIGGSSFTGNGGSSGATSNVARASVSSPTSWTVYANVLPAAVEWDAQVVAGGRVYILGGMNNLGSGVNTIYSAAVTSDLTNPSSWISNGAVPGALGGLSASAAVTSGNTLYIYGGAGNYTVYSIPLSTLAAGGVTASSWTSVGTIPNTVNQFPNSIVDGNNLYILGSNSTVGMPATDSYGAAFNTGLSNTSFGMWPWYTDGGNNTGVTWPLTQTTTYTLSCIDGGSGLPDTAQATVTINQPPTCSLTNASINTGQNANLTYTTANIPTSVSMTLNGVATSAPVPANAPSGESYNTGTLNSVGTYLYKATVTNALGSNSCQGTVTVNNPAGTLGTGASAFHASPARVAKGGSTSLIWTTANMSSCTIAPAANVSLPAECNGSSCSDGTHTAIASGITAATTYTLTCTDANSNQSTQSTTVNIVPQVEEI